MNIENQQSLGTQGDNNDAGKQIGGTTNLSLDQLQQEGGIANATPADENPNRITNQDDLNEIRVGDDLGEPDVDEYQPDNAQTNDEPNNTGGTESDYDFGNNIDNNEQLSG
jgi:hypothetical protein